MRKQIDVFGLLVVISCIMPAMPTSGAEFKSPKGYSFSYPDTWEALPKDELAKINEEAVKVAGPGAGVDSLVRDRERIDFADNLNVEVRGASFLLTQKTETAVVEAIKKGASALSQGKASEFKTRRVTIDGKGAVSVGYEMPQENYSEPTRRWVVVIPGAKQTYTITCTALKSHWPEAGPAFVKIVNSFCVDLNASGAKGK